MINTKKRYRIKFFHFNDGKSAVLIQRNGFYYMWKEIKTNSISNIEEGTYKISDKLGIFLWKLFIEADKKNSYSKWKNLAYLLFHYVNSSNKIEN